MARSIISLFFLGVAIAVFFAWSKPNFEAVKSLREQQTAFDSVLASSKQLQKTRDGILSQYNSITQNDLERLNKLLPSRMKAIKIVIELENITRKHNLLLKNIDVQKPAEKQKAVFGEEKKYFDEIPITMSVFGRYDLFTSFLKDLEKSLSLIDINNLSFSAGKSDSYEFNISASTYWKNQ